MGIPSSSHPLALEKQIYSSVAPVKLAPLHPSQHDFGGQRREEGRTTSRMLKKELCNGRHSSGLKEELPRILARLFMYVYVIHSSIMLTLPGGFFSNLFL